MIVTHNPDILEEESHDWVVPTYIVFLRVLAFICTAGGVLYWAQLSGITLNGAGRFDLLALEPRVAYTTLAILLPFAGLGLWFGSTWGIALALACGVLQIVMHGYWADTFGTKPALLAGITFAAFVLAGYTAFFFWRWRRQRLSGY